MSLLSDLAEAQSSGSSMAPSEVNFATGLYNTQDSSDYYARRDLLIQAYDGWKRRVRDVTLIANGDWWRVWPDLTREPSAPSVANIIELGIAHSGAVGGAVVPSVKVPVPIAARGPEGERGAAKRERRIRELRAKSNYPHLLSLLWQDYDGAGACLIAIWADFDKPQAERNPIYMRFDPRHYYPVKDANGNLTELLVARQRNIYDLTREHPQIKGQVKGDSNDMVEEWWWFTDKEFLHAVVDLPTAKPSDRNMYVLAREKNDLGCVPAVEIQRPTFDGERRGKFDQTIHILRTMHHLMTLTIERTEEEVYPAVAGWDVEGLEKFGPGAVMQYRSGDGKIDVKQPGQFFDVKDLIARLEENARMQSRYPQQLSGDPGASIASARAIGASMGALDASLAVAHKQFEWGLAKADSLALQFDETYCDGPKTIYGDGRDRKNPESFIPSRDIAGQYDVVVSYGMGAGADPQNREVRIQMQLGSGIISRKRARDETDYLEDPEGEEVQVAKETMMGALMQGFVAQVGQGDTRTAIEFMKILNDHETTMEEKFEVLLKRMEEIAAQQQPEQGAPGAPPGGGADPLAAMLGAGGGGGLDAAVAQDSLNRGGIPGQAEGLPPLDGILGPGAPRQI